MTGIATYLQSSGPNEVGAWQTPFQMHPAVAGRIVAAKKSLHFSDDGGNNWTTWGGMGTVRSTGLALTAMDEQAALVAKNDDLFWRDSTSMVFEAVDGLPGEHIGDVALAHNDMSEWWVTLLITLTALSLENPGQRRNMGRHEPRARRRFITSHQAASGCADRFGGSSVE